MKKIIKTLEKEKEVMKNKIKNCEEKIEDIQSDNLYLSHCNNRYKSQITNKDKYISTLNNNIMELKNSRRLYGKRQMLDPMD